MKRMALFLAVNVAAVAMLTAVAGVVCAFLGVDPAALAEDGSVTVLLVFAFLLGMGGALISLLLSKTIVKASMRCRTIDGSEGEAERWLVTTVADLAQRAHLKTPEVCVYPGEANAFATGAFRNGALVAVSTRIMEQMTREELRAVLGHEISHVANGDMVTMSLAQGVVNTFVIFFSHVLAFVIRQAMNRDRDGRSRNRGGYWMHHLIVQFLQMVFGLLASIVLMWYSRRREFAADAGSARLLGSPAPMVAALRRLGSLRPGVLPDSLKAFGIAGSKTSLLASHPALEDRIRALLNQAPPYAV